MKTTERREAREGRDGEKVDVDEKVEIGNF